ncbi:MAG: hypothetical protein JJU20_03015 [Opitutales bacterium]|nr:hypothetical protein [Opitutales bacterium]
MSSKHFRVQTEALGRMLVPGKKGALIWYALIGLVTVIGFGMAIRNYPVKFDWMYTVLSHLASLNRNPDGGRWISAALVLSCLMLWPITNFLRDGFRRLGSDPCIALAILRTGLFAGVILGIEGYFNLRFSDRIYKAHEAVAFLVFIGFYVGLLSFYLLRIRRDRLFILPAAIIVLPLCLVGVVQLLLYLSQQDLGWVSTDWRAMGIPFYLSFAFWQWVAVACLGFGVGHLVATLPEGNASLRTDNQRSGS